MRSFHGRFGDMWFHFRNDWPLRMWPSNSLRRSGNSWTLLRGPCTGTWCWRPTGTFCLWVRMTSFQSCLWVSAFSLCAPWEALMSFIWEFWWLGHDTASQVKLTLFRFVSVSCHWLRIKPAPPALEMQSLNHWITRGVPGFLFQIWILSHFEAWEKALDSEEWRKNSQKYNV